MHCLIKASPQMTSLIQQTDKTDQGFRSGLQIIRNEGVIGFHPLSSTHKTPAQRSFLKCLSFKQPKAGAGPFEVRCYGFATTNRWIRDHSVISRWERLTTWAYELDF